MTFSIPLFRLFGIPVFLDASWILYAIFRFYFLDRGQYHNKLFAVLEFLVIFGIVLAHEFGHALACKSVGGRAERIVLWPLGGVAYVQPPFRPGAHLWSIVAGPLVNVVLVPVTIAVAVLAGVASTALGGDTEHLGDVGTLLVAIAFINAVMLVFNLLPIYPLDGGQILQSILWFIVGPITSLRIVSVIGIIGAFAGGLLAVLFGQVLLACIAVFAGMQSFRAWGMAKRLEMLAQQHQEPWNQPGG